MNTARYFSTRPEFDNRHRPAPRRTWRAEHISFQKKYTGFLLAAVFGAVALFMLVASYQLYQNYEIFKTLAYATQPSLVTHLEREMTEFSLFVIATLASVFTFCLVLGLRMTANIIRPLIHMERHMKKVINGDLGSQDFRYHSSEDMSGLMDTYAYMYRSLRAHTESELKLLEKLNLDPQDRESIAIWQSVLKQKRAQLNLPERPTHPENGEATEPPRGIPRAS